MPKYGIITSFLGQTKDRFHVYNKAISLEEKFQMVTEIPGYTAVEIVYPYEVGTDSEEVKALLKKYKLDLAALNVNIKGEPEFVSGGITSPKKEVRDKAVQFIKNAKDFAKAIGAPHVTCCPLGDGFEFPFQEDYAVGWKRLCDTFGEAAAYQQDMPLFIEYKPKETRRHCFLPRAADTLQLLNDIKVPTMGVTMDYGHSIYAGEHPAQTLCMLADSDFDYYIHINDNDKSWDWDFFCGSHTLLDYLEFLFYARRLKYDKHMTSDTHPTRWDLKAMFEINTRITDKLWKLIETVGDAEIQKYIDEPDYMKTWRFVEEELLRLK
ncbi:MAG: sugar phosphate isomerase/epimerase family protein [Spirochaetota bacterium]